LHLPYLAGSWKQTYLNPAAGSKLLDLLAPRLSSHRQAAGLEHLLIGQSAIQASISPISSKFYYYSLSKNENEDKKQDKGKRR
jgi:hypothetical protein